MAIKCNITTLSGVILNGAYCRVVDFSVGKNQMSFNLQIFADKEKSPVETDRLTAQYDLTLENPYIQAYKYIKNLPRFTGAQDC